MALSDPEIMRRRDLRQDKRRLQGRAARYRRLAREYQVLQEGAEIEIRSIEEEIRRLDLVGIGGRGNG